jgi:hypothetical protein
MSKEALAKVVQRAISDAGFRRQLSSDPAGALRGFDLTADETSAIRTGDVGRLSTLGVDQRMSKLFSLGALAATQSSVSDLTPGAATMIDDASGVGSRTSLDGASSAGSQTSIPADPTLQSADVVDGNSISRGSVDGTSTARTGDDWKFAGSANAGDSGMANYPAHDGLSGPSAAQSVRAGDDWARTGTPAADSARAGDDWSRAGNMDDPGRIGNARVDSTSAGASDSPSAFIDESEAYLSKVGYDPNVADTAVTDAHDRGDHLGTSVDPAADGDATTDGNNIAP